MSATSKHYPPRRRLTPEERQRLEAEIARDEELEQQLTRLPLEELDRDFDQLGPEELNSTPEDRGE